MVNVIAMWRFVVRGRTIVVFGHELAPRRPLNADGIVTIFIVFDKMLHARGHRDAVRAKATDARMSPVAVV